MASMVNEEQRARILKGVFESYYADRDEPIIFDTNRAWTAKLPSLMKLFPEAKLVCLVRDVAWIMDSMERQFQNNAFENTRIFPILINEPPSILGQKVWRVLTVS